MDWSGCPAVERVPGKVSGQWLVKGTRILADGVLENADAGYTAEELATKIYEGLRIDQARVLLLCAKRQRAPVLLDDAEGADQGTRSERPRGGHG